MPLYVYEAKEPEKGCEKCRGGFEIPQRLSEPHLARCPYCHAEVFRVMCPPGLTHSKTDLHYRAKRAGFHTMKRIGKGEYEKMY